jgi:hypothetical protein
MLLTAARLEYKKRTQLPEHTLLNGVWIPPPISSRLLSMCNVSLPMTPAYLARQLLTRRAPATIRRQMLWRSKCGPASQGPSPCVVTMTVDQITTWSATSIRRTKKKAPKNLLSWHNHPFTIPYRHPLACNNLGHIPFGRAESRDIPVAHNDVLGIHRRRRHAWRHHRAIHPRLAAHLLHTGHSMLGVSNAHGHNAGLAIMTATEFVYTTGMCADFIEPSVHALPCRGGRKSCRRRH